jgi:hypothetical protein
MEQPTETNKNTNGGMPPNGSMLNFSFIPSELAGDGGIRGKMAIASVICGSLSLVTWVVIFLGIVVSSVGIAFSVFGMRSIQARRARVGLTLSTIGLFMALLYAVAAARGIISSNYFTTKLFLL